MLASQIIRAAAAFLHGCFRSRLSLQLEILALRHQLAVCHGIVVDVGGMHHHYKRVAA